MSPAAPEALAVNRLAIPQELTAISHWVNWRYALKGDHWTKVPYQHGGQKAAVNRLSTWAAFDDTWMAYEGGGYDGIGFVLTDDDELCAIDLDHCIDVSTGEIEPWALEIIELLDSYTEISPSGSGIHIFVRAELPAVGRKRGNVEMYEAGRYLTVTGHQIHAGWMIEKRQEEVELVHARYIGEAPGWESTTEPGPSPVQDDEAILTWAFKARNGAKAEALYNGDDSLHTGDRSAADLALVSILAFYTQDAVQLDRLFRGSARMRPKWDEPHSAGGLTYGQMTIGKALSTRVDVHAPELEDHPYGESLIEWGTFWSADRREASWLIEPLLPRGRAIALCSPAKAGKSLFTLDVAARAATGSPVLDWPGGEAMEVVYLDMEMTEDDLYDRLLDMGYGPKTDLSHFHYYLLPNLPPLDTADGGAAVRAIAHEHNAELVIIDTTSRVISGKENDADMLLDYYRHTGRGLKADGVTVWRLDHTGKDTGKGQRGTSAKNDDVDLVWQLTSRNSGIKLTATHRRQAWVHEVIDLERLSSPFRHERVAESWPTGTEELARILDSLEVPLKHGRPNVRKALTAAGEAHSNAMIDAAIRWRRKRPELSGQRAGTAQELTPGQVAGTAPEFVSKRTGDTQGDRLGQGSAASGDSPPTLVGDCTRPEPATVDDPLDTVLLK